MSLLKYSHNRDDDFSKTSIDLYEQIESFADQKTLSPVYNYFENRFDLPVKVVKQKIKRHISALYEYREGVFGRYLNRIGIFRSFFIHMGFLACCLIFSSKGRPSKKFKLIIDGISSSHELERFSKLIRLYGPRDILVLTTSKEIPSIFPKLNSSLIKRFFNYDRKTVWPAVKNELCRGIWLHLRASFNSGINLFPLVSPIVNDHLMYRTIFKENKAAFIIQERHYNTSSIKNHLFKTLGGTASTCIQKNILSKEQISYYYDMDCFFTLGTETATRAFTYGGRIGQVVPVGSLFMEHYWLAGANTVAAKEYDVVMLGINATNAMSRLDAYNMFVQDYYDTIRWLVRFKQAFPEYKIAIVHHASAGKDETENRLVRNTGIEQLDKRLNSYEVAFKSKTAVTFGSTMGYELNAHGIPTLFLDPGGRGQILPDPEENLVEPVRMKSYEEMETVLSKLLNGENVLADLNTEKLCLNSARVSEKIIGHLNTYPG